MIQCFVVTFKGRLLISTYLFSNAPLPLAPPPPLPSYRGCGYPITLDGKLFHFLFQYS